MNDNNNLIHLIDRFTGLKILVIGEAMLDVYLHGQSERLSREAPVPVVSVYAREDIPGGAANTAVNVNNLGARVNFLSVVGDDLEGELLLNALQKQGISSEYILQDADRQTLSKKRVLSSSQMIVRFDQGTTEPIGEEDEEAVIENLRKLFPFCDALIVSDYGYGLITPRIIETIAELQARQPHIVVVDSKQLSRYNQVEISAVKPNYNEIQQLLGDEKLNGLSSRVEEIIRNQQNILNLTPAQIVAVTLDEDGALVFERGRSVYRTYANPVPNSCAAGAGDTFVSALTLALAAGAYTPAAAEIASAASAIVVRKDGTASCYAEELKEHFSTHEKMVTDAFLLAARINHYRRHGQKIVFTNGCFDILHRGHVTYLNKAKEFGDILIVGLNSDDSVRRLKGENRPINTLEDRGQILSALSCVDHIIPFNDDTPEELIKVIQPNVFVKGGDYTLETLPEAELVEDLGGEIRILPYVEDHSTTGIIERIRKIFA